jgi:hypothetical protein
MLVRPFFVGVQRKSNSQLDEGNACGIIQFVRFKIYQSDHCRKRENDGAADTYTDIPTHKIEYEWQ